METGQVLELVSRRIVRTRGANSYNLNANDTAPDAPDVNPEFSSRIFSAVHDSTTDRKKLRLIPPGDMDSLNDLKHGESLNIRFIDGAIGDSYTEFGQAVYNICDKNGEQIVDSIAAGDIMPFIFDKNNKQFKLRFTVNSHPRIHDGNATVKPGDETVHDGNYVNIPDSPFIEYGGEDNLTYENSLYPTGLDGYGSNCLSTLNPDHPNYSIPFKVTYGINFSKTRNGIYIRNNLDKQLKLFNKGDNNFKITASLNKIISDSNNYIANIISSTGFSINNIKIFDKKLNIITIKDLMDAFNNKEFLTIKNYNILTSAYPSYNNYIFIIDDFIHKPINKVYTDGQLVIDQNRANNNGTSWLDGYIQYFTRPNSNIEYITNGYYNLTYYDKLPSSILNKESVFVNFIPVRYVTLKDNNAGDKAVVFNGELTNINNNENFKSITGLNKDYLKVVDLFNMDNVVGKFLRNATGFFVYYSKSNDHYIIEFAYDDTYTQILNYLIQEKCLTLKVV